MPTAEEKIVEGLEGFAGIVEGGTKAMADAVKDIRNGTDLWPWYWINDGEKCYAFATVEAFPATEGDQYPEPGTELIPIMDDVRLFVGENGTKMIVENTIATSEQQNGDVICRFIALAHANLVKPLETCPE